MYATISPTGARQVHYPYEMAPGRLVAVQRMAVVAGLCFLDPGTHLCVHPVYGPWLAFRAVLLFDVQGPPGLVRNKG
ncbi:unnamed protein product [Phaeothamnion confervicola]